MSISVVGAVFIALGLVTIWGKGRAFVAVLSASAALITTAAVTFTGNSIPPFYILAALATVNAVASWLRGVKVHHPAPVPLALFVAWSVLITAIGPAHFAGIPVLAPRSGIDTEVYDPTPLAYTPSMLAQLAYVVLGAGVVLYLAQRRGLTAGALTPAFLVGGFFSLARLIPGLAGPLDSLFRNYASADYNPYEWRHFGVFSEPSYLAVFSIAALAYALFRFGRTTGRSRAAAVLIAIAGAVNLLLSASGTAALAAVILGSLAIVYYGGGFLFAHRKLHPAWLLVPFGALLLILTPNPMTASLTKTITEKAASNSLLHRFASDMFSLDLTMHTWGLGVGLGANRPSSFLTLVMSSVGVIGFLLLVVVVYRTVRAAGSRPAWLPTVISLLALITAKVIAEPALSTPLLWFSLGLLVCAGCTADPKTDRRRAPLSERERANREHPSA